MHFLSEDLEQYVSLHSNIQNDILKELERETNAKILMPRMVSGHLQGEFLSFISKLIQPKAILEIGTYTGYSAICLAQGLLNDGKLHTIDVNEELEDFAKKYFAKAGLENKIVMHVGKALDIIPTLNTDFDLIFIDADKSNNLNYYEMCINKMKSGGVILIDNVLWSGKVVEDKLDKDSQTIDAFNKYVKNDIRVEKVMVPLRDGILMVRKK